MKVRKMCTAIASQSSGVSGWISGFVVVAVAAMMPAASHAAVGYSGQVTGAFANPVTAGSYISQTAGANAQTVPNYSFVFRNNNATAVTNINNGAAISTYTWGNANGLVPQPAVTQSSVSWVPVAFNNVAPGQQFLLGKIIYTNGTITLGTGAYGATLNLSGVNVTDNLGGAVAVNGLALPFTNWDTTNMTSGYAGAVKGLAGNNVVNAAGQLFDNAGNPILDNVGNQVTVPGPSFYDTFWNADYISFQNGQFANFSNTNDAGTFEGQQAVFDVFGHIQGDPQIIIDSMALDDGSLGLGFVDGNAEELAPEPAALGLIAGATLLALRRRQPV